MKHAIITFTTILISTSWIFTAAAQNMSIADNNIIKDNIDKDAKLDFVIMQAASSLVKETFIPVADRDTIPAQAVKNFEKSFTGITGERWEKTTEGNYFAAFSGNNKTVMVVYGHEGEWMHTIFNYGADQLDQTIKTRIISTYNDYRISFVDEVNAAGCTVYLVHIENDANLKTIKICNGKMGEIQTVSKN